MEPLNEFNLLDLNPIYTRKQTQRTILETKLQRGYREVLDCFCLRTQRCHSSESHEPKAPSNSNLLHKRKRAGTH